MKLHAPPQVMLYQLRLRRTPPGPAGSDFLRTVFFVRARGLLAEATPSAHLDETARETEEALRAMLAALGQVWPADLRSASHWLKDRYPMHPAARAGIETLLYDDAARRKKQPLHRYLGLDSPDGAPACYSLPHGSEEELERLLDEAGDYPIFKLRCGGPAHEDLERLRWIGRHTDKPLRVDAGGHWTPSEARSILPRLGALNVEYVQQPLGRHFIQETRSLLEAAPCPILLDEDVLCAADVARVGDCCHGLVINLMSSGGYGEALHMIRLARDRGLRVALDVGVQSLAGVTAAAHLAAAVDYANLGFHHVVENDPIDGVRFEAGRLVMPKAIGLGIRVKEEYADLFN